MVEVNDKIIFLDIDNVLNNDDTGEKTPTGFVGIDDYLVERLAEIVKATNAKIVLVSTWKQDFIIGESCQRDQDAQYLYDKLNKFNLIVADKTNDSFASYHRHLGILDYLDCNKINGNYVILDDFDYYIRGNDSRIIDHWIQTYWDEGLTKANVNEAIHILND